MIRPLKAGFYRRLCRIHDFIGQHAAQLIGASDRRTCQQPATWQRQNKRRVGLHGLFLSVAVNAGGLSRKACIVSQERLYPNLLKLSLIDGGPPAHFFIAFFVLDLAIKRSFLRFVL